jgi:4-methyl-5(b-hydroxyethyl)-thiazole monophosphate biosynthesis
MPGSTNLDTSEFTDKVISYAQKKHIRLAAICAAPLVLGKRGYLQGKKAVCYPGFENFLEGAEVQTDCGVVRDCKVITAKGMGVALEFGLALVTALKDAETAAKIKASIFAK